MPAIPKHEVFSAGENGYGQLFDIPGTTKRNEFKLNNGLKQTLGNEKFITMIDSGDDFTVFVTHDNTLFAAGLNSENLFGLPPKQKDSTIPSHSITHDVVSKPTIIPSSNYNHLNFKTPKDITHLSCGANHICVVTEGENIYISGLLKKTGKFTFIEAKLFEEPYANNAKLQTNFVSMIDSGLNYTVVVINGVDIYIMCKVIENTNYYYYGYTSTSHNDFSYTKGKFVHLKRHTSDIGLIRQISCGKSHFVFLNEYNELYGTGKNESGQLGQDASTSEVKAFCKIKLPTTSKISQVECGYNYTLVVAGTKVYGCGDNQYGQLGIEPRRVYEMVEIISLFEDIRVSCGRLHTIIHLVKSNQVLVSGANNDGQLGISSKANAVRKFTPYDFRFGSRISHVLCGRGSSIIVTQTGLNEVQFKQKLITAQQGCRLTDISLNLTAHGLH